MHGHVQCVQCAHKGVSKLAKVKINLSLEEDTAERLKQYAYENHKTVSQAVTDWIWAQKVKGENLRGQISLSGKKRQ